MQLNKNAAGYLAAATVAITFAAIVCSRLLGMLETAREAL
jgi:hypothetical protein